MVLRDFGTCPWCRYSVGGTLRDSTWAPIQTDKSDKARKRSGPFVSAGCFWKPFSERMSVDPGDADFAVRITHKRQRHEVNRQMPITDDSVSIFHGS